MSSLFKTPKVETPSIPAVPPSVTASPPPTPTSVDSQNQAQDMARKRRKQLQSGILSTLKTGGLLSPSAQSGIIGKNTLG